MLALPNHFTYTTTNKLEWSVASANEGIPTARRPNHSVTAPEQVCRAAGYYEHALAVAQAAAEPEWCLEILLEDCRQFDEALDFLRQAT